MRTSQTFTLVEPTGAERIPEGTLGYFRSRHRHRAYSLVIREFKESGLTQADLARRLGKGTDLVCRWLRTPGNWTLDTLSDLLFAISGGEASYAVEHPLRLAANNKASESISSTSEVVTLRRPPMSDTSGTSGLPRAA